MVNTIGKSFRVYRKEAYDFAYKIRIKIEQFGDNQINLIPISQTPGEFLAGKVKCSGVILEYEAQ